MPEVTERGEHVHFCSHLERTVGQAVEELVDTEDPVLSGTPKRWTEEATRACEERPTLKMALIRR